MANLAEEIENYRAKVKFQHKFENVKKGFEKFSRILSPPFFARNVPFYLRLIREESGDLSFELVQIRMVKDPFVNVELQLSLITPSKTIQSAKFSCGYKDYKQGTPLSEIFPGEEILVDDAVTLEACLWVEEPQGIEYEPPKKKLRQELQTSENKVQNDAFASLLDSGNFSDVTFVVSADSSRVKAHKTILAARSDVFAGMLTSDMKEAKEYEIVIDDMGTPALQIMLRHIYTAQLEFPEGVKIDLKICQELANAGKKYDLKNLKEYAAMAMTEFVSLENAWELLKFAKRLKAEAATKGLTAYYKENVDKIIANL